MYVKSFTGIVILQFKQSGSNKLYLNFNILKLCLICDASNGSVYILNALISPTILPPKYSSNLI